MSLPPYTGRTSSSDETPAAQGASEGDAAPSTQVGLRQHPPFWPASVGAISLIIFAIVVPMITFVRAISYVSWFGYSENSFDDTAAQAGWFLAGSISGAIAVVGAIVALVNARGTGTKVLAGFAIALGILACGIQGLAAYSVHRSMPTAPAFSGPDCGPASVPAVFGPDSRYTACPEDIAVAQEFAATIAPGLPFHEPTAAKVDAFAGVTENGMPVGDPYYGGAWDVAPGVVAYWMPAPVTCTIFTWDGANWDYDVLGALADGGCVYQVG